MGSGCCIPKSLKVVPIDYNSNVPKGIVNITEESSPDRINEFGDLIAESFCGTTTTAPEPVLAWIFDHGDGSFELDAGTTPAEVLKQDPSEERKAYFKWLAYFCIHQSLRHGGCYALEDTDGKLCSAAITIPPNNNRLYDVGFCEMMGIINKLGGESMVPKIISSGIGSKKLKELEKVLKNAHQKHASNRHLFLSVFATKPSEQGKGHGDKLLTFINDSAKFQKVPIYLETSSKKNIDFYNKRGYIIAEKCPIVVSGFEFKADNDDKGLTVMTSAF